MYQSEAKNKPIYDEYDLNDRQILVLTKVANFGLMTTKMTALYFAFFYSDLKDKYKAAQNTLNQLIKKKLIKKLELGFGEYRVIFILQNQGKILTEKLNFYFIKSAQKIYQSGFRHQIIANHISIITELLLFSKIERAIHENQIRKMKANQKWISSSIPDYLFTTTEQKMIIIEYEKNLKNDPRKLVEKLINYKKENLKSIKNGIENIYYFVGSERKKNNLIKYFLKADEVAKEYPENYQIYLQNRAKIKIKSIEETQELFCKKFNCFELKSEEILM
ncbi:MAG: hypothetical protein GQ570_15580 [Helicobacteraceae bacterium]|nr:hypothetical protein [Helicobacteraceae bacterium]